MPATTPRELAHQIHMGNILTRLFQYGVRTYLDSSEPSWPEYLYSRSLCSLSGGMKKPILEADGLALGWPGSRLLSVWSCLLILLAVASCRCQSIVQKQRAPARSFLQLGGTRSSSCIFIHVLSRQDSSRSTACQLVCVFITLWCCARQIGAKRTTCDTGTWLQG